MRKILHLDMDAFYAAIEQRDDPALRGRPVIVGGSPDGRGVVATCSYEARRFGIHSAMPAARAVRLCPDAVFIRPRFDAYRSVSRQVQSIFRDYTDLVEPLSLDEAYLDVTGTPGFSGSATLIARDIKRRVREGTGLTISAGVSYNKFLAKQASDLDKPDGLHLITPEAGAAFVAELPIGRFHGVGRATERRMHALGIHVGADLLRFSLEELQQAFGKRAPFYYDIARGIDHRPVQATRERKSIGAETTFAHDLVRPMDMLEALQPLAAKAVTSMAGKRLVAHTVTLKVKYADFEQITRSRSDRFAYRTEESVMRVVSGLLSDTEAGHRPVRLLGVTLSGLAPAAEGVAEQLAWRF
ncbi:DNA polymerase-4 [Natronocella acetinitrilica]|uniref:DNA polymerase IV n=1 Tax=Natronocella acetinitrilica TaxID=414046 RepID=A0AAE3G4S4_9GAMM|nr:DNA polymerase IV [Natronocella acetinitrilica]MCP1675362.1 DNA polymerase-4 [Natronocella acetinitrilica]